MKTYIPHVVLALLVLGGIYLLVANPFPATPLEEPVETVSEKASPGQPIEEEAAPAPASGGITLPAGLQIVKQTAWATFDDPNWDLTFKYQVGWKLSVVNDAGGTAEQASLSTGSGTVLVSKERPIAQPARLSATETTRIIAGKQTSAYEYEKPNDTYAYYIYTSVSDGNDTYYVSIKSYVESREWADDFLERIALR